MNQQINPEYLLLLLGQKELEISLLRQEIIRMEAKLKDASNAGAVPDPASPNANS